MRMAPRVYSLRSQRSLRVIERTLRGGASRPTFRVVKISIQGNHIHLLVEADDKRALSSGMRGLAIRLAKGMNRMMHTAGSVIDDRYHALSLGTPTEVRSCGCCASDGAKGASVVAPCVGRSFSPGRRRLLGADRGRTCG
jgi:hypothetical protein